MRQDDAIAQYQEDLDSMSGLDLSNEWSREVADLERLQDQIRVTEARIEMIQITAGQRVLEG